MKDVHPSDCLRIADLSEINLGGLQVRVPQDYLRYYFQRDTISASLPDLGSLRLMVLSETSDTLIFSNSPILNPHRA